MNNRTKQQQQQQKHNNNNNRQRLKVQVSSSFLYYILLIFILTLSLLSCTIVFVLHTKIQIQIQVHNSNNSDNNLLSFSIQQQQKEQNDHEPLLSSTLLSSTGQQRLLTLEQQQQPQLQLQQSEYQHPNQPQQPQQKQFQQRVVFGHTRWSKDNDTTNTTNSKYAYAFLIAGIDPSVLNINTNNGIDSNSNNSSSSLGYKGFLYNVCIAARILKQRYKSTNDIWVLIQMNYNTDDNTNQKNHNPSANASANTKPNQSQIYNPQDNNYYFELSYSDKLLLRQEQIHIWYIPSPEQQQSSTGASNSTNTASRSTSSTNKTTTSTNTEPVSFASTVFEKFRIVQMIEYQRVMYLDSDIIPTYNLDYLFDLTDRQDTSTPINTDSITTPKQIQLQPNLIVATRGEASNGGLFILQPQEQMYDTIQLIIQRQRKHIIEAKIPYPYFDKNNGWGHSFRRYNDTWKSIISNSNGDKQNKKSKLYNKVWNYFAAHSDQGLLLYLTKYYIQNVSIVIGTSIENWIPDPINFQRDNLLITAGKKYGIGHTLPILTATYSTLLHLIPHLLTDTSTSSNYDNNYNKSVYNHKKYGTSIYIQPNCTDVLASNTGSTNLSSSPVLYKEAMTTTNGERVADAFQVFTCYPPYSNYNHFYGKTKPWQQKMSKGNVKYKRIQQYVYESIINELTYYYNNKKAISNINHSTTRSSLHTENDILRTTVFNSYFTTQTYTDPFVLWFHTFRHIILDSNIIFNDVQLPNYYTFQQLLTNITKQCNYNINMTEDSTTNNNNCRNQLVTNYADIIFLQWWKIQMNTLRLSPLGYKPNFAQHATSILKIK